MSIHLLVYDMPSCAQLTWLDTEQVKILLRKWILLFIIPLMHHKLFAARWVSSIDVTLMRGDVLISGWCVLPDTSCTESRLIVFLFIYWYKWEYLADIMQPYNFKSKTNRANWDLFGSLFAVHAKDFSRSGPSAEEAEFILSYTFTYCTDVFIGCGSITNTRRCDWWNYKLIELNNIKKLSVY